MNIGLLFIGFGVFVAVIVAFKSDEGGFKRWKK